MYLLNGSLLLKDGLHGKEREIEANPEASLWK
jgi:hypothetical protein